MFTKKNFPSWNLVIGWTVSRKPVNFESEKTLQIFAPYLPLVWIIMFRLYARLHPRRMELHGPCISRLNYSETPRKVDFIRELNSKTFSGEHTPEHLNRSVLILDPRLPGQWPLNGGSTVFHITFFGCRIHKHGRTDLFRVLINHFNIVKKIKNNC